MGMFDYRQYSATESAELANTSFRVAAFGQLDRIFGVNVASLANALGTVLPAGALANRIDVTLPPDWAAVDPAALGPEAGQIDPDGYYIIPSPLTGSTYSGPQAKIYEERDAEGHVVRLSVMFAGTNSPVDLPDYTQLNSGEIAPNMEPLLLAVRDYARAHGLGAQDVIVTGYSLGAAYTNVMAKYADVLADGFFAQSNYVAHAVPYTFEGAGRVLNIGYENDVVHRAAGDFDTLAEAVDAAPGLIGQDYQLGSATDNLILFDDDYASPVWPYAPFALYNIPGGWSAHVAGLVTNAVERITQSAFYDVTARESLVIVSNLSGASRATTWVEDLRRPSDRHDHVGHSAFLIGSTFGDRLRGNTGNDYIDAMAGDDVIRPGIGQNRIEGGAGTDTLQLDGSARDWSVSRLGDGTIAFYSKSYGLNIGSGIEKVSFLLGRHYTIEGDRLEDQTHGGLFAFLDQDVAYTPALQGTAGNDTLSGTRVFGLAGNDTLTGTAQADLLYGGAGDDRLDGRAGNDALYGGEGRDTLTGGGGVDWLNGGLGDDTFVIDAQARGRVTIEDFRQSDVERDMLRIVGGGFRSAQDVLAHAEQTQDGVLLHLGATDVLLQHQHLSALTADMLILG